MTEATDIWKKYKDGVEQHNTVNMYRETEREHNFYIGDQWKGANTGGEELPILNFIKPVIKYKVSMIAQTLMRIVYLSMDGEGTTSDICSALTKQAEKQWEKLKMDTVSWAIIKNAAIAGDHYVYSFNDRAPSDSVAGDDSPLLKMRLVDKTNVYFSDEQNPNINEQEWIILSERVPLSRVKKAAKASGIPQSEIDSIKADDDTRDNVGQNSAQEVKSKDGKCTSLLYLELTDKGLKFCRSTETVIYEPMREVEGLDIYPLCSMRWEEVKGSSRGASAVKQMIPNQLEVNKTAGRRTVSSKRWSYPTLVADRSRIQNLDELDNVNSKILIDNAGDNPIERFIQYLKPVPISPDAANLQAELIEITQRLEGAGDAALGQVDPENASGEAIKAARDQAAVPLNEQIAAYKQFVEDVAVLWLRMWGVYSTGGMVIVQENEDGSTEKIPVSSEQLRELDINIKIEASPVDPFSKLAQEMAIEKLFLTEKITFEEYVELLDDESTVPKAKLRELLDARRERDAELMAAEEVIGDGGVYGAVPQMPNGIDPNAAGQDHYPAEQAVL